MALIDIDIGDPTLIDIDLNAPTKDVGGFAASAKQAIGATIRGAGQAAGDVLPFVGQDNALKRYGQGIIGANPTAIQNLGDIVDRPLTAVFEATGNAVSSVAGIAAARAAGMGITAAAPLAGPFAPLVAGVGQAVAWLGPVAIAALPSFGGIRDKQILNDPENIESGKAKAVAALGAATVGAIETRFGPQNWAMMAFRKEGREALAKLFTGSLGARIAKGIGAGAAIEGAEELVQNPIEQLASGDDPTTRASVLETLHGGAMGAIGGGVLGGGFGIISKAQQILESRNVDELTDRAMAAVAAPVTAVQEAVDARPPLYPTDILNSVMEPIPEEMGPTGEVLAARAGIIQAGLRDAAFTAARDQQAIQTQADADRQATERQTELARAEGLASTQMERRGLINAGTPVLPTGPRTQEEMLTRTADDAARAEAARVEAPVERPQTAMGLRLGEAIAKRDAAAKAVQDRQAAAEAAEQARTAQEADRAAEVARRAAVEAKKPTFEEWTALERLNAKKPVTPEQIAPLVAKGFVTESQGAVKITNTGAIERKRMLNRHGVTVAQALVADKAQTAKLDPTAQTAMASALVEARTKLSAREQIELDNFVRQEAGEVILRRMELMRKQAETRATERKEKELDLLQRESLRQQADAAQQEAGPATGPEPTAAPAPIKQQEPPAASSSAKAAPTFAGAVIGPESSPTALKLMQRSKKPEVVAAAVAEDARRATTPEPEGKAVETFAGKYGKGMNELNARQAMQRLAGERPELEWQVGPSKDLPNPFVVHGYAKEAEPKVADREPRERTAAQLANDTRLSERNRRAVAARRSVDLSKDSIIEWAAKRGGISMKDRADVITEGNRAINGSQWLFTNDGKPLDQLANDAHEEGYLTSEEFADLGGVRAVTEKIRTEFNGGRKSYSLHRVEPEAQASAADLLHEEATALRIETTGLSDEEIRMAVDAAQAVQEVIIEHNLEPTPEREASVSKMADAIALLSSADLAMLDGEAETMTDAQFEERVISFAAEKQNEDQRRNAQALEGSEGSGEAPILTQPTPEKLKASAEAIQAADEQKAKDETAADRARAGKSVKADQVDLFDTQGGFDFRNAAPAQPAPADPIAAVATALRAAAESIEKAVGPVSKPETVKPDQEYEASLETFRKASREFTALQKQYRDKTVGDAEFLAGKAAFEKAQQVADAAETVFIEAKNGAKPEIDTGMVTFFDEPLRGDSGLYIATGETSAMFTLRGVLRSGADDYIVNLSTERDIAIQKAMEYAAKHGYEAVHFGAPETLREIERSAPDPNANQVARAAVIEPDNSPLAILSGAGLFVEERTAKSGKRYWAVTGNLKTHVDTLDALGFAAPFKMGGAWSRSVFNEDPTARLVAALQGQEVAPIERPVIQSQDEADKILRAHKLSIERVGDTWVLNGKAYDYRSAIKDAGGKWDGRNWTFNAKDFPDDPSRILAHFLNKGQEPRTDDTGPSQDDPERFTGLRAGQDARPDERLSGNSLAEFVGEETRALLDGGRKAGIPAEVIREQVEDAGAIVSAYEKGKPLFILGSEAGSGKTYVLGAAIRELRSRGQSKAVYVTMNQDLIAQIKADLAAFGIENVEFHTYAELSDKTFDATDAVLIFDEAQNVKNVGGTTARADKGQQLIGVAKMTIFASATPFENPVEARYMATTGIFESAGGFEAWAQTYGAAVKKRKAFNPKTGAEWIEEIVYWPGRGKAKDGAAARQWLFKQGVMSQRAMKIDPKMVSVSFDRNRVEQKWVDTYDKVSTVYEKTLARWTDANGNPTDFKIFAEISMHRENAIKRVLEASKAPFAIDKAKELLAAGKRVVIFTETKAERTMGLWRRSAHFKDDTLYTFPQMQEMLSEWRQAVAMTPRGHKAPPRPFAEFIVEIAREFHEANLKVELPSVQDNIVTALGGPSKVAIYTGSVSNLLASKNKADFLADRKRVIVTTMAKGGTGLSLHDKVGNRPTTQINLNLPWKATGVDQVSGRVARYGLQSNADIVWLFAQNIPWEATKLAPRVGARMRDMGAIVKGIDVKAANLLDGQFDFEGTVDAKGGEDIDKNVPPAFARGDGERDMIVRHNLTEANLLHAARMGGIPVPSLAINRVSQPFENFGEITLVGDVAMADPQGYARTNVIGADAYSPRYPTVNYQINDKGKNAVRAVIGEGMNETRSPIDWGDVEKEGAARFENEPSVMWKFLTDKGIAPDIVMEKGVSPERTEELRAAGFEKYFPVKPGDYVDFQQLMRDPEFQRLAIVEYGKDWAKLHPDATDLLTPFDELTEVQRMNGARSSAYEMRDVGAPPKVDKPATRDAMRGQIRGKFDSEFHTFAGNLFEKLGATGKIFRGFTYAGNKKYQAHTLDNVVAIMKKNLRGGENFNYGLGSLRAKFTQQFRSVAQIRVAKGNLLSKEAFEKVKEEADVALKEIWDAIAPYHSHGREFGFGDILTSTMADAAKMGIDKALKENAFHTVPDRIKESIAKFLTHLRNMPTEYFEANITRAVNIAEFRGAAVPEGTSQKALDLLKERGLDVETYKRNDSADRQRAVKAITDRNPKNTLFRRGTTASGLPAAEVRAALSETIKALSVPVEVHETAEAATQATGEEVRPGDRGFYHNGKIHLVAESLPDALTAEQTLWHEITHAGVDRMFPSFKAGSQYDNALSALAVRNPNVRREAAAWRESYGAEMRQSLKARGITGPEAANFIRLRSFEEAAAKISETVELNGLQRFVASMQKLLRAIGLNRLADSLEGATNAEVGEFIRETREAAMGEAIGSAQDMGPAFATAYHGTPHVLAQEPGFPHGRFRLDRVGTGQGAASYGHGIYFGEAEGTGDSYRAELANDQPSTRIFANGIPLIDVFGGNNIRASDVGFALERNGLDLDKAIANADTDQIRHNLESLKKSEYFTAPAVITRQKPGSLYRLDIPDDVLPKLLDWDRPLSEQTEGVRKALRPLIQKMRTEASESDPKWGRLADPNQVEELVSGRGVYQQLIRQEGSPEAASEYLASIGIPGNKYLDQGSRGKGVVVSKAELDAAFKVFKAAAGTNGEAAAWSEYMSLRNAHTANPATYNYVIWDQKVLDRIALLERNGEKLDAMREADAKFSRKPQDQTTESLNRKIQEKEGIENAFRPMQFNDGGLADAYKIAFGVEVVYVSPIAKEAAQFLGIHYGGRIYINPRNQHHGFVQLAGHELLHKLREDRPDLYDFLATQAEKYTRPGARERYFSNLETAGGKGSDVQEEALADFTGDALADPAFLRALANNNPSKFRQLLTAVVSWLKDAAGKLTKAGFGSSEYFTDVNALKDYLLAVLDEYKATGNTGAFAPNPDIRFSRNTSNMNNSAGAMTDDPSTEEAIEVQTGVEGKSAVDAAMFIFRKAQSKDYRLIAFRIARQLRRMEAAGLSFDFRVAHLGQEVHEQLSGKMRGMTWRAYGSKTTDIWVQGADVTGLVGVSYETVLHELLHAATQSAIYIGNLDGNTTLHNDISDLRVVHAAIAQHFNQRIEAVGGEIKRLDNEVERFVAQGHNALRDLGEVVSWALTNRRVQEYLESIPYRGGTLWTKFVNAIRIFLHLPTHADTALSEILRITDRLLDAPLKQLLSIGMPTQINRAGGLLNNAAMAQAVANALPQGARGWIGRATDYMIYNYQDSFMDLRRRVQAVKARGALREDIDPSLAEELYSGTKAARVKDFQQDMRDPLVKAIHDAGLKYEQTEEYLHAKHAPSRNAAMRKINPTEAELDARKADLADTRDTLAQTETVQEYVAKRREQRQVEADIEDGLSDESAGRVIRDEITALRRNQEVKDYQKAVDQLRALNGVQPYQGDNTALSGMSNSDADEVIAKARRDGHYAALERISGMIDAITARTRQNLLDGALITPAEIAAWEERYEHYVPLHRDEVGENPVIGQGFNIRGKESRRATGSEKPVIDILAHVIAQHEASIIRAEKNKVDNTLFRFIQENPDDAFWQLDKTGMVRDVDPRTGTVVNRVDPRYKNEPNVLTLKIDGEEHTITFDKNDAEAIRLAAAMKNLSAHDLGEVTMMVGKFTRLLATMNTSANPVFVARNFLRDLQTAFVNLSDTELANVKQQVFKDVPGAIKGFWDMTHGRMNTAEARMAREFRDAGGQTGWMEHYADIGERADKLRKMLSDMEPGKWNLTKEKARTYWEIIEGANSAVENGVRLAAYMNARRIGLSKEQSASIAKNLTVNFNRHGAKGVELNMWYMFMNASIQGTARLLKAVGNKDVQKILGYVIASGFMLDILARSLAGDDDNDGENDYDQLPEYVKDKNFVLWLGRPITIPMPYGYNFFSAIGRKISESMWRKNYSPVQAAGHLTMSFLDAFSPTGQTGSMLQFVAPTIADPLVQWAENKNFAGNPMRREQIPFGVPKPEYQMGFKSNAAPAKWLAETLNDLTGGNEIRPGVLNLNPAVFDFAVTSIAGGAGRTYLQLLSLPIKAVAGDDIQAREVPFANIFASAKPEYQIERHFYENLRKVQTAAEEVKHYRNDSAELAKIRSERAVELRLAGQAKMTASALEQLRKRERLLERLHPDGWRESEKRIEEQKREIMARFNKRYSELRQ